MQKTRIAIVGGGLSGLYAAWLLEQSGITDYVLLEARQRLGGRILSPAASGALDAGHTPDRVDLGPSWFWPAYQPQLDRLVRELGLVRFEQAEDGDMMVEHSAHDAPIRRRGFRNVPASMRLLGGMGALVTALADKLDASRRHTGYVVRSISLQQDHIVLDCRTETGAICWQAEHVLLAIPPRLAVSNISFSPSLPMPQIAQWQATATWMAPHAKYVAVYAHPFWHTAGLSGEARSMVGPLGEMHDASMPEGSAALSGFFQWPAMSRQAIPVAELKQRCRQQLARIFGPQAAYPLAEFIQDWALDDYTATAADLHAVPQHAAAPSAGVDAGLWQHRITGIASEWSPSYPGYVAGAIEAAGNGVGAWLVRLGVLAERKRQGANP